MAADSRGRTRGPPWWPRGGVTPATPYRTPPGLATSRRREQPLELLPRHGRRRRHAGVLVHVGDGPHAHERGADAGRGAHELERALSVGGEARQRGRELGRQAARGLAL